MILRFCIILFIHFQLLFAVSIKWFYTERCACSVLMQIGSPQISYHITFAISIDYVAYVCLCARVYACVGFFFSVPKQVFKCLWIIITIKVTRQKLNGKLFFIACFCNQGERTFLCEMSTNPDFILIGIRFVYFYFYFVVWLAESIVPLRVCHFLRPNHRVQTIEVQTIDCIQVQTSCCSSASQVSWEQELWRWWKPETGYW